MERLVIPSAKLVPDELQNLGKLPPIIYPINQRTVFDYLFAQYKNACNEMEVICYEAAHKVKKSLESYTNRHVAVYELPELRDLGYTLYWALKTVSEPVIINFGDTIVMDNIFQADRDAYFYAMDYVTEKWTFFEEEQGHITKIYDKTPAQFSDRKKMFVGVFRISNTPLFAQCLSQAIDKKACQINTFYYALSLYSQQMPMQAVKTDNWFDIGHADKYYNSKLEVKAREFNHILIDRERGILRKRSDDKEKFIGEILWYLKLPTDLEYVRPRIFSYSTSYENPYVEMEYYAYHTIHELFLYGDLQQQQWIDVFQRLRFIVNDFKRYTLHDDKICNALNEMYLTKTICRLDKIKTDKRFSKFFQQEITINGIRYQSLSDVKNKLKIIIPEMLYDIDTFSIIHGDLCFSNIMIDSNLSFVKVIDPRGKFGTFDIYGDSRYELAKLFHSIAGKYDFIIKDLFDLDYDTDQATINYAIHTREQRFDLYKIFTEVFCAEIGDDFKKIELIEALLFLSMVPLHGESVEHQMVMLGTGIEILDRIADIRS